MDTYFVFILRGMYRWIREIQLDLQSATLNKIRLDCKGNSIGFEVALGHHLHIFAVNLEIGCDCAIPQLQFLP